MKVILTEKEKEAATWFELDDETVGKLVKSTALHIKGLDDEQGKVGFWSAALILCSAAAEANADTFKQTMDGLTIKGKDFGTWEITIKRIGGTR
jgi:hypothetical protein